MLEDIIAFYNRHVPKPVRFVLYPVWTALWLIPAIPLVMAVAIVRYFWCEYEHFDE